MRLFAVVWDFIQGSLLTTKGDLVKRGAAVNERLAVGAAKTVLGVNDAADDLEYRSGIELATVRGDLLKRGVAEVERLPVGDVYTALMVNAARTDLMWAPPSNFAFETEGSAENPGNQTITNAYTAITSIDIGLVTDGDRILVNALGYMTKGGVAGNVYMYVKKVLGTATLVMYNDAVEAVDGHYMEANGTFYLTLSLIAKVTGDGTLTIGLGGMSIGSDSVCGAGAGQLYVSHTKKL